MDDWAKAEPQLTAVQLAERAVGQIDGLDLAIKTATNYINNYAIHRMSLLDSLHLRSVRMNEAEQQSKPVTSLPKPSSKKTGQKRKLFSGVSDETSAPARLKRKSGYVPAAETVDETNAVNPSAEKPSGLIQYLVEQELAEGDGDVGESLDAIDKSPDVGGVESANKKYR